MHADVTSEMKPESFAHLCGRGATATFSVSPFPDKGKPVTAAQDRNWTASTSALVLGHVVAIPLACVAGAIEDSDLQTRNAQMRTKGLMVQVRTSQGYARTFDLARLRLVTIQGAQCRIQQVLEGLLRSHRHAETSWHCPSSPQRGDIVNVPWATFAIAPLDDPRCRPLPNSAFLPCFNANELMVGDAVHVHGSPFACLCPDILSDSVRTGHVSAIVPVGAQYTGRARTRQGHLLLLDFRGLPGMEGSPVLNAGGQLCAVLLPSLHCQSLGASLWFAVPINMMISAIASSCISTKKPSSSHHHRPALNLHDRAAIMSAADVPMVAAQCRADPQPRWSPAADSRGGAVAAQRAVAMVRLGGSWGSAVVIDAERGLLLTVAHLFSPRKPSPISELTSAVDSQPCHSAACTYRRTSVRSFASELVGHDDDSVCQVRWTDPISGCFLDYKAKLVHMFKRRPTMDAAVIQICTTGQACKPSLKAMGAWDAIPVAAPVAYRPGNAVAAVGHSLIGPGARLGPMVTFGCLSYGGSVSASCGPRTAVTASPDMNVLMTDCLIHSGCSGGALVLMQKDDVSKKSAPARQVPLLGLITSNAAIQNGPVLPSIGFAIPATLLKPIIQACMLLQERSQEATAMLTALDVPDQTPSKL
eukprot:jgi/Ulvmu1/5246/UM022_0039.1